jgi:hypothetical protein
MPSTRLAFLSVAVGSALLGWATAGVTAIGAGLPDATTAPPAVTQPPPDVPHHHHDPRPGV